MTETSDDENKVFEEFWNQPDKDWMKEPYFVKGKIAGLEMAFHKVEEIQRKFPNDVHFSCVAWTSAILVEIDVEIKKLQAVQNTMFQLR